MTATELQQTSTEPTAAVRRGPSTRLLLLGLAGLYLAWVLVIPPFAGIDEFDHAYRAAAAARGQWDITPSDATRGTGAWLRVPNDIVAAAQPECQARKYTKNADCVGTRQGSVTRIASGAGRYHPLFYAVIGYPARAFSGTAALYVMRLAAVGLSLLSVWGALVALGTWSRSRWGGVGLVVACSPVVVYSGAIVAPNGLEMTSALALWCALVGLAVAPREHLTRLLVVTAVAGATLCTLRGLGPLWCLLAVGAVLVGVRRVPGRLPELLGRPGTWVTAGVVAASALQATVWTLSKGVMKIGAEGTMHVPLERRMVISGQSEVLWVLQSIAAFPFRNDATHPVVYACYLVLFGALLVFALRVASGRLRLGIALVILAALAFPFASTVSSYNTYLVAWQGRYGLPLTLGIVVLATLAMERSGRPLRRPWWLVGGGLYVVAQTVSVAYTLHVEKRVSPLAGSSAWLEPSLLVAGLLAVIASTTVWWSTSGQRLTVPAPAAATSEQVS